MNDAAEPAVVAAAHGAKRGFALVAVLALVGGAWALIQLYGLALTPFHTKGEPREAIVVQDLVRHGHWVLPRRNGVELPRKPPLFYWLAGITAHLRGLVDEATVRLPSALLSGAACLLVAGVGAWLYGAAAGALSGLALLTSFEWLRSATAARVDMTLTFGLTLVFVGLLMFRRDRRGAWLVLVYVGAAWATLGKGIPGLAIPVLFVLLLCVAERSIAWVRSMRPLVGVVAVLLVAAAWYVAAAAEAGRAFLSIVVRENFVRAVGETDIGVGHGHSVVYLVGALAAGLLPWTLVLPSVAAALWRDRRALDRRDPRLAALLWSTAVFVPYAFATSKRGVYLLPLYPAVALLLGWWAGELVAGRLSPTGLAPALAVCGWALALGLGVLALAAAAQSAGWPVLAGVAPLFDVRAARDLERIAAALVGQFDLALYLTLAALAAVCVALAAALRRWSVTLIGMITCIVAVAIGVRTVVLPAIAAEYTRVPFVAALRRAAGDPAAVHTAGLDYGTLFYWGSAMPPYDRRANAAPPPYLLLSEPEWLRMAPAERRQYRRVPGLAIPRSNNQGYLVVLERSVSPPVAPPGLEPEAR